MKLSTLEMINIIVVLTLVHCCAICSASKLYARNLSPIVPNGETQSNFCNCTTDCLSAQGLHYHGITLSNDEKVDVPRWGLRTALKMKCIQEMLKREERDYGKWRMIKYSEFDQEISESSTESVATKDDGEFQRVIGFFWDHLTLFIVVFLVIFFFSLYWYFHCLNAETKASYGDIRVIEAGSFSLPPMAPRPSLGRYPSSHPDEVTERRSDFFTLKQSGMTATNYKIRLEMLALEAEIEAMTLKDHLVHHYLSGLEDEILRDKINDLVEIMWENVCEKILQYDTRHVKDREAAASPGCAAVAAVQRPRTRPVSRPRVSAPHFSKCMSCGRHHGPADTCPALMVTCHGCGRKGHIKRYYRSKDRRGAVNLVDGLANEAAAGEEQSEDDGEGSCHSFCTDAGSVQRVMTSEAARAPVAAVAALCKATPNMMLSIASRDGQAVQVDASPDTGAHATIVNSSMWSKLAGAELRPSLLRLFQADGVTPLKNIGTAQLDITSLDRTIRADCLVCPEMKELMLLSWHHVAELDLLSSRFPSMSRLTVKDSEEAIK
eukprot:maker-scaffold423_size175618-snap-gene-0.12 protein:Tk11821 transcript:maker-scaffold423_size175618-snap-gene-0.12-mRNA-1 annotation:"conserved hypothetical protein"